MFGTKINAQQIVPTSKVSLKMSCLAACGNDIAQADKLYRYIAEGLDSLPDFEPERISALQRVTESADEIFSWIGNHRDDFIQGWQIYQQLRGTQPSVSAPINVEPIPQTP